MSGITADLLAASTVLSDLLNAKNRRGIEVNGQMNVWREMLEAVDAELVESALYEGRMAIESRRQKAQRSQRPV